MGLSSGAGAQCFQNAPGSPYAFNTPNSVAIGDINGDGKLDLAVAGPESSLVQVLLNNGAGGYTTTGYSGGVLGVNNVVIGDLNGDGKADLVTTDSERGRFIGVLLSNGAGGYSSAKQYETFRNTTSVAIGDLNGDGKADLVVGTNDNVVEVFLNNGAGDYPTSKIYNTGTDGGNTRSIAIGDLNGDGKADLATANSNGNNVSVLLNNGVGGYAAPKSYTVSNNPYFSPYSVAIGDLNSDGKADLAVGGQTGVSILFSNGAGGYATPIVYPVSGGGSIMAIGDLNGDGKIDLAVAAGNSLLVLLNNGVGVYDVAPTSYPVGMTPVSIAIGDLNGDGKADLTTANKRSNDVSVLFNCNAPTVVTLPFAITGATVNCETVSTTERRVTLSPQYAGLDGQPVSFSVYGELATTTIPAPYSLRLYVDNPIITLKAMQQGTTGEVSFNYNWLAACTNSPPPVPPTTPFAITGATVNCETVSATERRVMLSPQYAGLNGQPVNFSVYGELATTANPGPYTLRLYTDNPTITLKATQQGTSSEMSFSYNWLAACTSTPPPVAPTTPFTITGATTVNCLEVSATERRVTISPNYAGLNGQPVSFSVFGELDPTTAPGPYSLRLYIDNPTITLKATQQGTAGEVSFIHNWLANCFTETIIHFKAARIGVAETTTRLSLQVLGNPVQEQVRVLITGVDGQAVRLRLTDLRGRELESRLLEQVNGADEQRFDLRQTRPGMLLLQAISNGQTQTVKIIRQ